ncbi:hypothetical protein HQN64_04255 [Enterobacteriaceae bacterium BIT-l23]|uniref:hypothetical protein n=1 Tax=Jejubacter sp. L23 TaxID=3092086 RepID=UPI0015846092|nr:hypothetical protein [Enterobacteriaceae bacterium BIT-l23]
MSGHTIIVTTIVTYIIAMPGVSLYAKSNIKNTDDYHLASRHPGTIMLAGTLAVAQITTCKRVVITVGIIIAFFSRQIIELLVFAFTIHAAGPFAACLFGLLADNVTPRAGLFWQIAGAPPGHLRRYCRFFGQSVQFSAGSEIRQIPGHSRVAIY